MNELALLTTLAMMTVVPAALGLRALNTAVERIEPGGAGARPGQ